MVPVRYGHRRERIWYGQERRRTGEVVVVRVQESDELAFKDGRVIRPSKYG
jgi:hypothetical protein